MTDYSKINEANNALIEQYKATRDEALFEKFINQMKPRVYKVFLRKNLHSREDLDDAFQMASMVLFRYIDRCDTRKGTVQRLFFLAR